MLLVWLCTAALAGIAIGDLNPRLDAAGLILGAGVALLGATLGWRQPGCRLLALVACAVALGALRATLAPGAPPAAPDAPTRAPDTPTRAPDTPTDAASLLAPFEQPMASLTALRATAENNLRQQLPDPQASLAVGVLLGGSTGLDADFKRDLQRSGLSHLIAIDGFKLTVVTAGLGALAVRTFGRRLACLPVGLGIVGYTLLTGAHPSAIRAALMVGLAMLAALSGRVADPLTSVLLASVAMAGLDPRILLDLGLQLSLSATLGIVLLWPRWRRRLRHLPHLIAEPAGLTLAVTCATLPVTLSVFSLVSLVSPLAHVLAVPLLAPVLLTAGLLALVSPIPPLALLASCLTWLPTTLLVEVIHACAGLPGAAVSTGRLAPLAAGALAGVLLTWGVLGLPEAEPVLHAWARLRARCRKWWTPLVALGACLAALGLSLTVRPDGRLHLQPLDAGRGQAVLIRGPTGRTALVVSGRLNGTQLASQVAGHLAVWEHKLDCVIQLDAAAAPGLTATLARYPAPRHLLAADNLRIDLGGGAVLDVYAPDTPPSADLATARLGAQIASADAAAARLGAQPGRRIPGDASPVPDIAIPPQKGDAPLADIAVSFGQIWVPLLGNPPPPLSAAGSPSETRTVLAAAPATPFPSLVSDGNALWADELQRL